MDVHARHRLLDGAADRFVGLARVVGMDAALQTDLGGAALPRLDGAAGNAEVMAASEVCISYGEEYWSVHGLRLDGAGDAEWTAAPTAQITSLSSKSRLRLAAFRSWTSKTRHGCPSATFSLAISWQDTPSSTRCMGTSSFSSAFTPDISSL